MTARVSRPREQAWGSDLQRREISRADPYGEHRVREVLQQLTALADSASNYFNFSCGRVEGLVSSSKKLGEAQKEAKQALRHNTGVEQLKSNAQQLAQLRQQQWEAQQRAWAREHADAVRQASQKPGVSRDVTSRRKLPSQASKDSKNIWRKSVNALTSLAKLKSTTTDTTQPQQSDQASAPELSTRESSKIVLDQLAHGEGPLTMSIALQHTKTLPQGLEAVQEDEREGQESPLLEEDEEGEEDAGAGRRLTHRLLMKEVLAAEEALAAEASAAASTGGPVQLAPAKFAAVPVPDVRKSMKSFSVPSRSEAAPTPTFSAEMRKSFSGRQQLLQPAPSSMSPEPPEGRPALRSVTGPLSRSIAVRHSSIRQRVDEFDEEEGAADPFRQQMMAVFAAEDAKRKSMLKEMRSSRVMRETGGRLDSSTALPLTSSLPAAARRTSSAGSLAGSQSMGTLGQEAGLGVAGEPSEAGGQSPVAPGTAATTSAAGTPRRLSSMSAASVARRLSEAASMAAPPQGQTAVRRSSVDSNAWGSAAAASAPGATRQGAAASGSATRQASAAGSGPASAVQSAPVSRQPSTVARSSQQEPDAAVAVTAPASAAGSAQDEAGPGELQFLDLDAINAAAAEQVRNTVQLAEQVGMPVSGQSSAAPPMFTPRASTSEIEPAEGAGTEQLLPQPSANLLAGARMRAGSRRGSAAPSPAPSTPGAERMVRSASGQALGRELPPPERSGEEPTTGSSRSKWQQAAQRVSQQSGAAEEQGARLRNAVRMSFAEIHASSGVELSPMQAAMQATKRQPREAPPRTGGGLPPAGPRGLPSAASAPVSRALSRSMSNPMTSSAIPGWGAHPEQQTNGMLEGGLRATAQQWRRASAAGGAGGLAPGHSPGGSQGPSPRSATQGRAASWQMLGLPSGPGVPLADPYADPKVSPNKYAEQWGIATAATYGGMLSRQDSGSQLLPRPVSGAATPLHASPRISYGGSRPGSHVSESGSGAEYASGADGPSPGMGDGSYPNGRRVALSQPPAFIRSRQGSQVMEPSSYPISGPFSASPSRRHSLNGAASAGMPPGGGDAAGLPVTNSAAAAGARQALAAALNQNPVPTTQQAYTAAAAAMNAAGPVAEVAAGPMMAAQASVAARALQVIAAGVAGGDGGRARGRWVTGAEPGASPVKPGYSANHGGQQLGAPALVGPGVSAGGHGPGGQGGSAADLAQQQAGMRHQGSTAASRYASAAEEFSTGSVGVTPRNADGAAEAQAYARAACSGVDHMTAAEMRGMAAGGPGVPAWGRAGVPSDMLVTAGGVMVNPGLQAESSRGLAQLPALAGRAQW